MQQESQYPRCIVSREIVEVEARSDDACMGLYEYRKENETVYLRLGPSQESCHGYMYGVGGGMMKKKRRGREEDSMRDGMGRFPEGRLCVTSDRMG